MVRLDTVDYVVGRDGALHPDGHGLHADQLPVGETVHPTLEALTDLYDRWVDCLGLFVVCFEFFIESFHQWSRVLFIVFAIGLVFKKESVCFEVLID